MSNVPVYVSVAVGAGVLVGALGVVLYETLFGRQRRTILQEEVVALSVSVSKMRSELKSLREEQDLLLKRRRRVPLANSTVDALSRAGTEFASAVDELDEEFFDLSDNEDTLTLLEDPRPDANAEYDEIDRMLVGNSQDKLKAYGLLLDFLDKNENDPEILWRLAQACHVMVQVSEDIREGDDQKESYLKKGIEYATRCLEVSPRSADAHKWYAICVGSKCKTQPAGERIRGGLEFKKHIEEAMSINPEDPSLYHLLGRFQFEVATLSWIEKRIASAIYGSVPTATMEEAIESLKKTEELSTEDWKENRLLLAKAYLYIGNNSKAFEWLKKADDVFSVTSEDMAADEEIQLLKDKLRNLGLM